MGEESRNHFVPKWILGQFLISMFLVLLGTLILIEGAMGVLNPKILLMTVTAVLVGAVLCVLFVPREKNNLPKHSVKWVDAVLVVLMVLVMAEVCFLGCLPPTARDALIHHLAIPKWYLRAGEIFNIPFAEQAYNPMLMDMLFMVPLALSLDVLANQIHFGFAVLTATVIFHFVEQFVGRRLGLLSALIFLSLPVVVKSSSEAYVDLGVTYFSTLSLCILYYSLREAPSYRWVCASGMVMGAAMATKYNGFLLSGLTMLLLVMICFRAKKDLKKTIYVLTAFVAGSLVIVFPWLLRNWMWTGNPIFPFFRGTVGHMPPLPEAIPEVPPLIHRFLIYKESVLEILLVPIRIFFTGREGVPEQFDGSLTPILILFLPFLLKVPKKIRPVVSAGIFVGLFYLLYVCFFRILRVRYLLPMVPILVALCIMGLHFIGDKWVKKAAFGVLSFLLILNLCSAGSRLFAPDFKRYFLQGESRENYLRLRLPEYGVQQWANTHLLPSDKILFVYLGFRGYYCDIPYTYDFHDDLRTFRRWLKEAKKGRSIREMAKAEGINYIMVHREFFAKSLSQDFDPEKYNVEQLKAFFDKDTKVVFRNGPIDLVSIS